MIAGNIESLANQPRPQQATGDSGTNGSKDEDLVPDLDAYKQIPSEAALPNVILGAELAARTGLDVGGIATLVSSESTLTPLGVAPRYRRVRVGGIFRYGLFEYDSTWIYLPLEQASSFAGLPPETAGFVSIETNDIYNASRISAALREKLGAEYSTVDWQEANRPLFAALALERRMALFIIGLIVFVAVLNITSTLILVVVERRNDIAILGAMGTSGASITAIFVIEGAVIGLAGAVAGVILGFFASAVGNYYKLVGLPPDVYSVSNVPFHFHVRDALLAALVAFALSVIATIYPARAAARIRPADALRD
jgi:lipoprotein-releasing system permease protein